MPKMRARTSFMKGLCATALLSAAAALGHAPSAALADGFG